MKHQFSLFKSVISVQKAGRKALLLFSLILVGYAALAQPKKKAGKTPREYIQVKVYHAGTAAQLSTIENYLQASLLPDLAKSGFRKIGVFTAVNNDTAADKKLYVMIPFQSVLQLEMLTTVLDKANTDSTRSSDYTKAAHNQPSFTRNETILLRAFAGMPQVKGPKLNGELSERVYELRSYESASEALFHNKVKMFNDGEVELFDRLGFNAVFYGEVIAGSRMPNLMYMTSFDNKASRDEHWKNFGSDPAWKKMSSLPQYQNNVSKIDITFLRPTAYSRL